MKLSPVIRAGVLVLAGAAAPLRTADAQSDSGLTRVLQKAGEYVRVFQRSFAEVLSTEQYQQTVRRTQTGPVRMRRVESEMFFTAFGTGDAWMTIRNVMKVDGQRIHDSHDRVMNALSSTRADRVDTLRKLAAEGARYNIGNVYRTFNDPTVALMFMAPELQRRFHFSADGIERIDDILTRRVRFQETARPSIIRNGRDDVDADVSGTANVADDGRVLRTELLVAIESRTSARVRVHYKMDDNVDMLVPSTMEEDYRNDDGPSRGVSLISCTASYSDYQRFQTSVRILPR